MGCNANREFGCFSYSILTERMEKANKLREKWEEEGRLEEELRRRQDEFEKENESVQGTVDAGVNEAAWAPPTENDLEERYAAMNKEQKELVDYVLYTIREQDKWEKDVSVLHICFATFLLVLSKKSEDCLI